MADTIAYSLNTLFESDLFKENNFIKIYDLLDIYSNVSNLSAPAAPAKAPEAPAKAPEAPAKAPEAPAKAPAAPAAPAKAPAAAAKAKAAKAVRQTEIKINRISNNLVISGGFYQSNIDIPNFYNVFTANNKTILSNILSNIKNENILDKYQDNIIIDPANIGSISEDHGLKGQYGLSGEIYKLLDNENNTYIHHSNLTQYIGDNHTKLYTDSHINAFYGDYNITKEKEIHIIHTVGPSFRDNINDTTIQNDNYMQYLSYNTFNKIYNDILHIYNDNNKDKDKKLLLVPISSGLFATYTYNNIKTNITNEILTITAAIFINLYLHDQKVYMYIYNKKGNKGNYTYFIEQINKIIDFINFIP